MRSLWHTNGITRAVGILLMLAGASLHGVEKHVIAQAAETVLVGTFKTNLTFPWFDGWHLTGSVDVDEVLYGPPMPLQIELKFVCEWPSCRWWPPPQFPKEFSVRGLWFLKRTGKNTWEPSADAGFRNLSERDYWESYIRQYKR
jgi:hypothetical protein